MARLCSRLRNFYIIRDVTRYLLFIVSFSTYVVSQLYRNTRPIRIQTTIILAIYGYGSKAFRLRRYEQSSPVYFRRRKRKNNFYHSISSSTPPA